MKMKQICMSELHSFINGMRDAFTDLNNSESASPQFFFVLVTIECQQSANTLSPFSYH